MSKLKVDQFVDVVRRSGLVDDERLNQALSGVDQSVNDSGIVASSLTKAGLLTEWQSEKLLQGRHKGFYLGKYKLLNHIGTGGMGAVYLAEHRVMRHRVAIKLLPNHLASHTSYLERFHQEARASASLNHPNMVRAHDVDHEGNVHYLIMDFVDGTDLQVLVSRSGPLPYRTAADYTRQAADGLAYAHRSGLIHRDIKPANLLVDKAGTVKILDMGLARFTDESQGSLTMAYDQKMIGTVDYLAPEQALDSHHVDARVDIYSLGCALYFMLTGDAPFPQGTIAQRILQHQTAEPTDIHKTRPEVPDDLIAICRKMMAKSADDRYQTADEVSAALSAWLGDSGTTTGGIAPPEFEVESNHSSLNEDLDLAPLEDEPSVRPGSVAAKQGDSKAETPSKSGAKKPKSDIKAKTGDSGAKGSPSGVRGSTVPRPPAPPSIPLGGGDDLMDELLSTASPTSSGPMHAPAFKPIGHAAPGRPLWLVIVLGLACGGSIAAILALLAWVSGKIMP